jgi:CRP-like cAMP-binding protein
MISTKRDIARELARRYSTMTTQELDVLEDLIVPGKFAKNEIILGEGDICKYIYYIDKGLTRQFYFKNSKEVTEYMAYDHSIVMCIESLFKDEPSRLQIQALETTEIYGLSRQALDQISVKSANIGIMYRKILEESLIISQIHADMVRFESALERYKRLMSLQPELVLRAPLVYIASYLQMTPETLSRVRAGALAK